MAKIINNKSTNIWDVQMVIKSNRLIMTVSCHEKTMCTLVVTSNSKSKSMFLKLFMIKTSKVASAARAHSILIMKNLKIV